jgi:hypothetical protein
MQWSNALVVGRRPLELLLAQSSCRRLLAQHPPPPHDRCSPVSRVPLPRPAQPAVCDGCGKAHKRPPACGARSRLLTALTAAQCAQRRRPSEPAPSCARKDRAAASMVETRAIRKSAPEPSRKSGKKSGSNFRDGSHNVTTARRVAA